MFTKKGIYLIEYNVRLGDPECQTVLSRLNTNLLDICLAIRDKKIKNLNLKKSKNKSACVVMASHGYPEKYSKGFQISIQKHSKILKNTKIFHAGTKRSNDGKLLTNGGRVLNIVAIAKTIKKALDIVYKKCNDIYWKGSFYRKDIGS